MSLLIKSQKIGFLGAGNMTHALIKGIIEGHQVNPSNIMASNRSPGKLIKLKDQFGITTFENNESLIENCDIVVLATKPQDLLQALEPVARSFHDDQIVISLAAGIKLSVLEKHLPHCRVVRLMPNTPSLIGRGVIGYLPLEDDNGLSALIEDLASPLGRVYRVEDEDQFDALMIACSSGTGFVFELMMYWQEWLEEHGFNKPDAKEMVIETFLGASLLASQSKDTGIEELQARVASKKGVTGAGLQSMREIEIERALRLSFEKAAMRSQEMTREFK